MLKITIELMPHGNESRKRTLAVGKIWNDATGTQQRGNYRYILSKCGKGNPSITWKDGGVLRFPRKQQNAWRLLYEVLRGACANE